MAKESQDDNQEYQDLVKERLEWYEQQEPMPCPLLGVDVHFTAQGFYHVLHKGKRYRKLPERMYKLRVLPMALTVIANAKKIYEYRTDVPEVGKQRGKRIEYWELSAPAGRDQAKVNVIIRKIGDGPHHFYSIMRG